MHAQLYLPPVFVSKSNTIEPPKLEIPEPRPTGLADELASGLATALTHSPHSQNTSLHASTDDLLLTNLIPANLLPSSLILPTPAPAAIPTSTETAPPVNPPPTPSYAISDPSSLIPAPTTPLTEPEAAPTPSLNPDAPSTTPTTVSTTIQASGDQPKTESEVPELAAFSPAWMQSILKKRGNATIRLGDVEADFTKTTVDELKKKLHSLDILSAMVYPCLSLSILLLAYYSQNLIFIFSQATNT